MCWSRLTDITLKQTVDERDLSLDLTLVRRSVALL
jgi:hypothetical protein